MTKASVILHATSLRITQKAVLIIGPSGSGKSSLALQLLALGAGLISDDRTLVSRRQDALLASAPEQIAGLIEARGVGLLQVPPAAPAPVALVVDLAIRERDRLPLLHHHRVLGIDVTCLHNADSPHFAAAIMLYLKGSRKDT
ncbi:HPr kinase/phosphorylase [Sulfitobacter aestuarii]|uniref:HPr kinase/phosphorylase n=1 Tax=Sulfitobacter aestuarii TaxID=2161676 RepID=A0ABW5TY74_9RHOB